KPGAQLNSIDPLFGLEVPFLKNLSISNMLDFGGAVGHEIAGLIGGNNLATFTSVQALDTQLNNLFGHDILAIAPTSHLPPHALESGLSFKLPLDTQGNINDAAGTGTPVASDFDFNLNLGPLHNLAIKGSYSFDTLLELAFTAGINIGSRTEHAAISTAFAPFGIIALAHPTNASGQLSSDPRFPLHFRTGRLDVTVAQSDTANNGGFGDLAADVKAAIKAALDKLQFDHTHPNGTLDPNATVLVLPTFDVKVMDGRLQIVSPNTPFLEITKIGQGSNGFSELGFTSGQLANDGRMPENGVLTASAEFGLVVGSDSTVHTVQVASDPNNKTAADLRLDLQSAVDAAVGAGMIDVLYKPTATRPGATAGTFDTVGGIFVLSPHHAGPDTTVDFIRVLATGNAAPNQVAANELGLRFDALTSDILRVGEHELDATFPNVPANGQLSADSVFTVTLKRGAEPPLAVQVTVHKEDTSGNVNGGDLAADLARAVSAAF